MTKYREILRLTALGLSLRDIEKRKPYLHSLTPQSLSYAVVISVRCQD